jgi:cupin superfamily acireductone dioxygenase involved in methionine salvage
MSFETLKVSELKKIAEDFAVETEGLKNKTDIISALAEEGVTWSVYEQTTKKINEESMETIEDTLPKIDPKKNDPENTVLVRMTRANFRYDILGHTFTREHPFVAMGKDDAQKIFDKEEGFRLATPTEVQEYYN